MAAKKLTTLQQRVAALAEIRATITALNDQLAAAKITQDRLELEVLNSMTDAKVDSVRAAGIGTVSIKRTTVPTAKDWAAIDAYILKHKALDLLQRRIGVNAWRERVEAGEKVPGIEAYEKIDLAWTKAKP